MQATLFVLSTKGSAALGIAASPRLLEFKRNCVEFEELNSLHQSSQNVIFILSGRSRVKQGTRTPLQEPKFLHFHAVEGKLVKKQVGSP